MLFAVKSRISSDMLRFSNLTLYILCRLPKIYEEFYHTVNNADHEKDLRWWSNTHGVNMPMNWPQFEVSTDCFISCTSPD